MALARPAPCSPGPASNSEDGPRRRPSRQRRLDSRARLTGARGGGNRVRGEGGGGKRACNVRVGEQRWRVCVWALGRRQGGRLIRQDTGSRIDATRDLRSHSPTSPSIDAGRIRSHRQARTVTHRDPPTLRAARAGRVHAAAHRVRQRAPGDGGRAARGPRRPRRPHQGEPPRPPPHGAHDWAVMRSGAAGGGGGGGRRVGRTGGRRCTWRAAAGTRRRWWRWSRGARAWTPGSA